MQSDEHFKDLIGRNFLPKLRMALWVFDIDEGRVVWANAAGLDVWAAHTVDELSTRDLSQDMSPVVHRRLKQYQEDFVRHGAEFRESWTLYPNGLPRTLDVVFRGILLPGGRMGMFCEAPDMVRATPEALRSAEAVLHTSVCISLLDLDGEILYANTASRAAFGGASSMGARFVEARDYARLLTDVAARGVFDDAVEVLTTVGRRWHHVLASRCFDAVTGKRAILLSENDVTEAQEARQILENAHTAAVEASRLKSEFVANMSHEIRTPLNGVLGVTQLLERTEMTPEQRELVSTLHSSGEALMGIIQDNLDMSRIEAGLLDLDEGYFSVEDLLREVSSMLFGTAIANGVAIEIVNGVARNHRFKGDAKRIRQVLINLAANAVKFSADTPVILRVCDIGDGRLEFAVTDGGPGIPEADQKAIFERFRQVTGTAPRRQPGTGLGLSISRTLVEAMGGEIGVESQPGAGATFWIRLPLARKVQPADTSPPRHSPARAVSLAELRVLLADDNETNQFIIRRLCELSGMDVHVVGDGQAALEALAQGCFDVVLMDIHMPVLSGADAIRRLRAEPGAHRQVPIIALSADAMESSIREVLALGADAYLTKPIDADQLMARIGRLASKSGDLCRDDGGGQAAE